MFLVRPFTPAVPSGWAAALVEDCLEHGKRYGHSDQEQDDHSAPALSAAEDDNDASDAPPHPPRPGRRGLASAVPDLVNASPVRRDSKPAPPVRRDSKPAA